MKRDANERASVMKYLIGVVNSPKASDQRRDRIARILLPYVAMRRKVDLRMKKHRDAAAQDAGEVKVEKVGKGKKAKAKEAAKTAGKGTKWDGVL